jgi:hypothetical protein
VGLARASSTITTGSLPSEGITVRRAGVLGPLLLEAWALLVGDSGGRGDDERFDAGQPFGVGQVVGAADA